MSMREIGTADTDSIFAHGAVIVPDFVTPAEEARILPMTMWRLRTRWCAHARARHICRTLRLGSVPRRPPPDAPSTRPHASLNIARQVQTGGQS